ncbi:hypothetical protein CerSpe_162810 [Prunus speciosa]
MGEWHDDEKEIQGIVVMYFEQLFTSSTSLQFEDIINCVAHRVLEQHNSELTQEVTAIEIQEPLFQIPRTRHLGRMGSLGVSIIIIGT